jgi:hypothetical protein
VSQRLKIRTKILMVEVIIINNKPDSQCFLEQILERYSSPPHRMAVRLFKASVQCVPGVWWSDYKYDCV